MIIQFSSKCFFLYTVKYEYFRSSGIFKLSLLIWFRVELSEPGNRIREMN